MSLAKHANVRCQQRGVPPLVVDLLLRYGVSERASEGASLYFFDKKSKRRVRAYTGGLSRLLEPDLNVFAVVSRDGEVITVGHRIQRVEHDRKTHRR